MKSEKTSSKLYILFIIILGCVLFWKLFIPGHIIYSPHSDYVPGVINLRERVHNHLFDFHSFPMWNQYSTGIPMNMNSYFYPFELLFAIIPFLARFDFLIHILLAGIFMFFCAKLFKLKNEYAFVSSIVFMFSTKLIAHVYAGHGSIIAAVCYIPLVFYLTESFIQKRKYTLILILGIVFALQFLTAHLQIILYTGMITFLYGFFRCFVTGPGIKEHRKNKLLVFIAGFIIAVIICCLVSSILLLPTLGFVEYSTRTSESIQENIAITSLNPSSLISIVLPYFFGNPENYWGLSGNFWESSIYIGILPLLLVIISMNKIRKDKRLLLISLLGLFALVFALGRYTPLYNLFHLLPGFNMFRVPTRMLFFFVFFASLFSAYGIQYLIEVISHNRKKLWRLNMKLWPVLFISLIIIAVLFSQKQNIISYGERLLDNLYYNVFKDTPFVQQYDFSYYLNKIPIVYKIIVQSMIYLSVVMLAIVLTFSKKIRNTLSSNTMRIILTIIVVVDLFIIASPLIQSVDKEQYFAKTPVVEFLEKDNDYYRVIDFAGAVPKHLAEKYNIDIIDLNSANFVGLADVNSMFENVKDNPQKLITMDNTLDMFNVKYIVTDTKLDIPEQKQSFRKGFGIKDHPVYKWGIRNSRSDIYVYERSSYTPRATIIYDNSLASKKAEIIEKNPNYVVVYAQLEQPGNLVLSEAYYPDWIAKVNGKTAEITKANGWQRSVKLDKGTNTVEFFYKAKWFKQGAIISIISLIVLIAMILLLAKKEFK